MCIRDRYRDPERRLDPVLRELGQTRAGWLRQSNFVYSQHRKSCRGLGMDEAKIDAIASWEVSALFEMCIRDRPPVAPP